MTPELRQNFARLLNPRHIAFVGGRDATIAITEARRRGFQGDMWAVNPKRDTLGGLTCYASVSDLPEAPDAVYLAIPAPHVPATVSTLSEMGTGGVVCFSAGFKETGKAEEEDALIKAAGDMALIGPNCYGLINYVGHSALWSFEHGGWSPGYGAAIITQSGMFSSDITMSQRSLPLAYMISAGNQAVLGLEDFLELLCDDTAVRAIGLHIEGLRDVVRFERAALRALANGVPVVALKTGSSAIGASLTVSHTGSLSGANELYEALFERTGVISVTNPSQFVETLKYLCVVKPAAGPRVAGFTCSGGGATMLADHGERIGLSFPAFGAEDRNALTDLLPDTATVSNPLDYTTPIWGQPEHTYPVFAKAIAASNADATVLVQDYPAPGLDDSKIFYERDAAAFARAATENGLPAAICSTLPENLDADTRQSLIEQGVAPMQGIHETLNAILHSARWVEARSHITEHTPEPLRPATDIPSMHVLTESAGKAWLRSVGFDVPKGETASAKTLITTADGIGYPVALKMMSPKLAHKTEAGAVALNLKDGDALSHAMQDMISSVSNHDASAVSDTFLVEEMSPPPVAELILTVRRDAQFGCALVLGSGGVLVELIGDAATLLLPASQNDIQRALERLKVFRLMSGFRGRSAVNVEKVTQQIFALCAACLNTLEDPGESLVELEINPLFVYEDRVVAVDVLLHRGVAE